MKKSLFRFCSMLLVLVMLINMLPMGVFAEEFRESIAGSEAATEEAVSEDAYVVCEVTEKRTEYSKEFLLSNGLHVATVYADPVHYETDSGWEEIDNTLKSNTDGTYSNTEGVWDVKLPQQLSGESITIEKDGYTLSFSLSGELNTSQIATYGRGGGFSLKEAKKSHGKVQEMDWEKMHQSMEYEEMVPEKSKSRLTYSDVYENTDIIYDLDSNTVKESIVLGSYSDTLQGYTYTLEVGAMIPVLEEDGSITLYDESREKIVMVMPAPYLVDDAGEYSYDIEVQLTGSGSTYTLSYILPTDWLAEEARSWPVIMDPWIEAEVSTSNISDVTVAENAVTDYQWGYLQAGYGENFGVTRAYLMFDNLPALTSSDVVVHAQVSLLAMSEGLSNSTLISVHKVNKLWESKGLTWSNKPGYNENIEDYVTVDTEKRYGWNITDIVRDWYANENTGMMFKASNEEEDAQLQDYKSFYSSDYYNNPNYLPALVIYFRNNNGLESYWDYTTSSAGRAGTGYVNNFTGNLTFIHNDIGFSGNRMPVSINHVYNLNDAIVPSDSNNSNDSGGNSFGMGIGWRTNYNQLLYQWSVDSDYYVWEDGDGTDHYFTLKDGKLQDEDGLELTLTTTGSGSKKYCITDKNGNCSYFDTSDRLTEMTNNQKTTSSVTISYTSSTSKLISSITDGVGRKYNFTYTNGLLSKISYVGSGTTEISYVSFGYSGSNLTSVTNADGETSTYGYDNDLLTTATDIDGYMLTYTYSTIAKSWQPYRTLSVRASDGSAQGGSLSFSYEHNQTTVTDHNGNKEILQFNDLGNLTCIQDDEGHAQYGQYTKNTDEDTGRANQLTLSSKLQNTVGNRLKDNSFEGGHAWSANNSALSISRSTETAYYGNYSLKLASSVASTVAAIGNNFSVAPGEVYVFSAYVKTEEAYAIIALQDGATYATYTGNHHSPNQDWARLQVAYTNTSNEIKTIYPIIFLTTAGTAYIDGVQVEKASMPSRYNIIDNGDFRHSGSPVYRWSATGLASSDGLTTVSEPAAPQLDSTVLKVTGNPTGYKYLIQYVQSSGSAGDCYVLSGWAKGNSVPLGEIGGYEREFEIEVALNNHDGTTTYGTASFNPDSDRWQYSAAAVVAEKSYHSISVIIRYNFNANTAYFDGIQLYKEEFGTSYTYDDDGNVISVEDLQGQTTTYEYDTSSNLTKVIQNNKAKMTYTYDSYHNVKTATTEEGLVYNFVYDTYGNNTQVSITSEGSSITSTAVYSTDGNRLEKTIDALGKETKYSYNAQTNVLEWVQYPEDTEDTRTEYTYDSMYRMAAAACETDTGNSLSASYTYEDDQLTKIETSSTTYNFTYGNFGLRTAVNVGTRNLAKYSYTNDGNNYLSALDYGNEDSVNYTYDDKGRILTQTYEDGDTVTYAYNNDGDLAIRKDSATGITTKYYYDLTGRLMKYEESGTGYSHSVGYEYDTLNNLTELVENINGTEYTTTYTYDDDNRVTSITTDSSGEAYTYDEFGRVIKTEAKHDGSTVVTQTATYRSPATGKTSAQVATYNSQYGTRTTSRAYTYDGNGNIATLTLDGYTTEYFYDTTNQLIRENNQLTKKTHTWTYDNAGNILSRSEYAYTTESLDGVTPTDTVTYTYGDSEWGDLLTAYDGQALSYDAIGNLTSDGTWTYTWEHGRQLASMTDGSLELSFTYNADGLRTSTMVGGSPYFTYVYDGDRLTQMTMEGTTGYFTYGANGPASITWNGNVYYYILNLQGDVEGIVDSSGTRVVSYYYDAWGNILQTGGSMKDTLGRWNPLRYRGYVYDFVTGLYYLQSRYYNPEIGRWISPEPNVDYCEFDEGAGLLSYNVYAYCANNPVIYCDSTGEFVEYAISQGTIILFAAALALGATIILFQAHRTLKNGSKTRTNDKHTKPRPGRESEKKKQKNSWKSRR